MLSTKELALKIFEKSLEYEFSYNDKVVEESIKVLNDNVLAILISDHEGIFERLEFIENKYNELTRRSFIKSPRPKIKVVHSFDLDFLISKKRVIKFYDIEFANDVIGLYCQFKKATQLYFVECIFAHIDLRDAVFRSKLRFHRCIFNSIDLENSTFYDLVDFYGSIFKQDACFYKTDFLSKAIFAATEFEKRAEFLYNKTMPNSYISFQSAKFNRGLDISRANFHCVISFWNIKYEELKVVEDHLESITEKTNKQLEFEAWERHRESCRIIKNSFLTKNDHYSALQFSRIEKVYYQRQLINPEIKKGTSIRGRYSKLLSLNLNWLSNEYGNSWINGVLFTLFFTFLGFIVVFIPHNYYHSIDLGKAFVKTLNVADWRFEEFNISGWQYGFLFFVRIFIGYGYYQTIQAFRNHGK